jgi:hypothetical protein
VAAFDYFGAVATEVRYDRTAQVFRPRSTEPAPAFADFAGYDGFKLVPCVVGRSRSKGQIERAFRYVATSFFATADAATLAELNTCLRRWLDEVANTRTSADVPVAPVDALQAERPHLLAVRRPPYRLELVLARKVDRYCLVRLDGARYSVEPGHVGAEVNVVTRPGDPWVQIRRGARVIGQHPRAGRGQVSFDPAHGAAIEALTLASLGRVGRHRRKPGRRPAWSQGSRGSGHPARPGRPRRRRDGPAGRPGPLRPALAAAMTGSDAAASYQTLRGHLAYLKLTRAEELLAAHLEAARAQQLSHVAFLEALLGEEVTATTERRHRARLRFAHFPVEKHLADFDFDFQPSVDRALVEELATLAFLDAGTHALFMGPPGVGKTHLAIGLGMRSWRPATAPTTPPPPTWWPPCTPRSWRAPGPRSCASPPPPACWSSTSSGICRWIVAAPTPCSRWSTGATRPATRSA